ncbi:MAG: HlyD family efflux transporter periplasmic adaptor subunit [Bacillota bacterium]|nr:HlyD family efflux transporter periplasmic adaptor subunit [Bacillota bacterium]
MCALALFLFGQAAASLWEYLFLTRTAEAGRIESSVTVSALIFRQERVYRSRSGGVVNALVPEGERIRPGTLVATVTNAQAQKAWLRRWEEVERRLRALTARPSLLGQKAAPLTPQEEEEYRSLQEEKALLEEEVQAFTVELRPQEAGTVSYWTDGLEESLNPSLLEALTASPDLWQRLNRLNPRGRGVRDGAPISPGTPVFKVVDNCRFWVAAEVHSAPRLLEAGERVWIYLTRGRPGRPLEAVVEYASAVWPQRVVFRVAQEVPELARARQVKVRVVYSQYEGIVIPRRALAFRQGRAGVYLREAGRYRFVPVSVVGGDAERVAVTGLPVGVRVLLAPPIQSKEKGRGER